MTSLSNPVGARRLLALTDRQDAWLCALLCAAWFGLTAGLRPLAIPDEGRYVGVAWEMLRGGEWSVPTLNGAPFFHKPPLFYWLTAAAMTVFGSGDWAARIASVVATTLAATLVFRFASRWRDARTAWTTVVVLATTPLFYGSSQYANLDPLVAACITATILCAADAVLRGETGRSLGVDEARARSRSAAGTAPGARGPLACAFIAAGCGVLAKGLIGVVLPLLVLLGWGLATGRLARVSRTLRWWPGWAMFLAIATPWFAAMQWRYPDFLHYFFVVQHFERFTATGFNNAQPVWFYPALLALGAAPWSPWWLLGRRRGDSRRRRDPHGLGWLMGVWAAVVIVFFSVPHSKPIGYILPALPPLAWWVAGAIGAARDRRPFLATAALAAALCVGAAVAEHFLQPKSQAALAAQLKAQRLPGEPVAFLGEYYFDVPVRAGLEMPVLVVDAWSPAEVAKDSWRRALIDAERFELDGPPSRLIRPAGLRAAFAGARSAWIVGPSDASRGDAWLASQTVVFEHDGTSLWHIAPVDGDAPPAF